MVNKKRKTLPKSPDRPAKAPKEPKTSAPPVSGILVAIEGGGLAFSPAPTRKKLASEPNAPSSSVTFPASQDTTTSEGIASTTPRNSSSTIEPDLKHKPLPLPFPPAFRHEDASPEEASLIPTTLPPHVEHVHTSPPTLSQTLDKESMPQTHAPGLADHIPFSDPTSDQTSDQIIENFTTSKLLLLVLQSQQALLKNAAKMESDIVSLKEENNTLRLQLQASQTAIEAKLDQVAIHLTENNKHLLRAIIENKTTMSKSKEDIQEHVDFRHSEQFVINGKKFNHIEESITSVNGKLSSMEGTFEKLQTPAQTDSPMDTTPMPQPSMHLPSASPTPQPPHRQSKQPTYASITGQNIAHDKSYTWLGSTLPTSSTVPKRDTFPKNTWTICFPGKTNFERPELAPQFITTRINRDANHTNIKATLAKWTLKRNLAITFSPESKEKDIMDASTSILKCLNINQDHAIFAKSVNWSKIVFKNMPCQTVSMTGEYGTPVSEKITDPESLLKAVQESHPLLKEATFVHPPDWTVQTLPEEAIYHNLRFTIEDPDSSIANNLIASEAIMFATTVRPRLWKDHSAPIPAAHLTPPY